MAFLIPDNLKSRRDVPEPIRRVAGAFQVALDEAVTVWYEPLYDPSGQKPHLVVLLPDRGIVVLEVLGLRASGLLGALRGKLRILRDGEEVEIENPLARAQSLAESLRQRIAAEQRLNGVTVHVGAGAVFPSVSRHDATEKRLDQILDIDSTLFQEDIEAAQRDQGGEPVLLRSFNRMLGWVGSDTIPYDKEKVLRGLVQPETIIDTAGAGGQGRQLTLFRPPTAGEDILRIMDRNQEAMAKALGDGHRIIRGVAGSGKTLVLTYRAKLLAKLMPRERFLVTYYTRSLGGQLREILRDHPNVDVINLDKLMSDTIWEAGLRNPGYEDDNSGDLVAEMALQALAKGKGPRYRAVLLDEAQDFGTPALQFVVGLLVEGSDDLVIVADAAQNIFRRKFSWKQAGIQAQGRTRILRINYRNTKEILEFASDFLLTSKSLHSDEVPDPEDENAVIPPESAARSGPKPELYVENGVREEVARAVRTVAEWAATIKAPRSIAVLYNSSWDSGIDRARLLHRAMCDAGLSVFWLSDPGNKEARDKLATAESPVVLSTIHSAKGLEFPYVVVCGIWRDGQDVDVIRKLAYVGMTRATDRLAVITRDGHPLVSDLMAVSA